MSSSPESALSTIKSDSEYKSTTSIGSPSPSPSSSSPTPTPPAQYTQSQPTSPKQDQVTSGTASNQVRKYTVALHTVRIQKSGQATDPIELKYPEVTKKMTAARRRQSELSFDPKQIGNKILNLIRNYWSQPGFPKSIYRSWIPKNKATLFELITDLCKTVQQILRDEPRILGVSSPCIVMGDIHGNLSDIKTYERSLWPRAPVCVNCNYLFLGDYVDRGDHSLESILYLLAMKLIAPDRFYLLRGNHEIAHIQRQYTFGRECESKFGNSFGRQLWRSFNQVFDVLPIAAIVDEQIFCAHGGIPKSVASLARLAREIPVPLDNPELQSPAAWEMLWNDPITDNELSALLEMDTFIMATTTTTTTSSQPQSAIASKQLQQPQQQQQAMTKVTLDQGALAPFLVADSPINIATMAKMLGAPSSPTSEQQVATKQAATAASSANESMREEASRLPLETQTNAPASTTTNQPNGKIAPQARQDQQQQQQIQNRPNHPGKSSPDDTNLRSVPSDTSSIASVSPQQILEDGFVSNIKRGTAYLFSDRAVEKFLKFNNLSHVIRAHEVIPTGFAFHGDGRVITIFSSSKYCGLNNQASCVLVDKSKIRILRLTT